MAIIGAVIAVGTGVYGVAEGANQKRRAKHQMQALERSRPVETIPDEVLKNQELANLRAKTGLPSEQYAMAQKNIQRQQARTLKAASDRKMGLSLLGAIDDNALTAQGNLDAQNAMARIQNEKTAMNINNDVANFKKGLFDRNVRQPWERAYDYNMALQGQGNQNITNSIVSTMGALGASASSLYKNGGNSSWANGLFGRKRPSGRGGFGNYSEPVAPGGGR